jgi:hypothetical protein
MANLRRRPLPLNPYDANAQASWYHAYSICLQIEGSSTNADTTVNARLLGYLILEAPVDEGRHYLCAEILECSNDDAAFHKLATMYRNHFLRFCKLRFLRISILLKSYQSGNQKELLLHHRSTLVVLLLKKKEISSPGRWMLLLRTIVQQKKQSVSQTTLTWVEILHPFTKALVRDGFWCKS